MSQTTTVRPIGRVQAIRARTARHHGLEVEPLTHGPFTGVVPVEDVWIEAPLALDERWLVAYRVVVRDGRALVAELRVFPNEPSEERDPGEWSGQWLGRKAPVPAGGLSTRVLRSIRLGHDVHSLTGLVDRVKKKGKAYQWLLDPDHGWYGYFGITEALSTKPVRRSVSGPGRPALPPEEYARVAAAYVRAIGRGSPTPVQEVARELALRLSTVRSRIHAARERGLLDRGRQGYAGGQLSPVARKLLKQTKRGSRHGKKTRTR
jgi:hypothetical protein